jgi:hypothetical protein
MLRVTIRGTVGFNVLPHIIYFYPVLYQALSNYLTAVITSNEFRTILQVHEVLMKRDVTLFRECCSLLKNRIFGNNIRDGWNPILFCKVHSLLFRCVHHIPCLKVTGIISMYWGRKITVLSIHKKIYPFEI